MSATLTMQVAIEAHTFKNPRLPHFLNNRDDIVCLMFRPPLLSAITMQSGSCNDWCRKFICNIHRQYYHKETQYIWRCWKSLKRPGILCFHWDNPKDHYYGHNNIFFFLFIKNSNLVYTNKPFVSNLICYCEFTKYLFYNNHFGSVNISALS
jgi:hypothetical protein